MPTLETTPNFPRQIMETIGSAQFPQMVAKVLKMVTSLMNGKVFLDMNL